MMADHARDRAARVVRNPWKAETWNVTEQFAVVIGDPVRAKRLKAEAGAAR
jgi:hypothetical protein